MEVKFKYSEKIEQKMINYFKKQGANFTFAKLPKNEVKKINEQTLNKNITLISDKWAKVQKEFFELIKKQDLVIDKEYICYLSRYGSSGYYLPANELAIRINNKKDIQEANLNISHELVHLALKKSNKDKNLEYAQREQLVDNILLKPEFKKILPGHKRQVF